MPNIKFGFLSRARNKVASVMSKIIPPRRPVVQEEVPVAVSSDDVLSYGYQPISDIFSFTSFPEAANGLPSPPVPPNSFAQHYDPQQGLFWAEPIDLPTSDDYQQNESEIEPPRMHFIQTRYTDRSSEAGYSSSSSWLTVSTLGPSGEDLVASLLRDRPQLPRLRRRRARSNFALRTNASVSIQEVTIDDSDASTDRHAPHQTEGVAEPVAKAGNAEQSVGRTPGCDSRHGHQPNPSVSDAVNTQIFTSPMSEDAEVAPTQAPDNSPVSAPSSSRRFSPGTSSSETNEGSVVHRPQHGANTEFVIGSVGALPDPFVEDPETTLPTADGDTQRGLTPDPRPLDEFSNSSDEFQNDNEENDAVYTDTNNGEDESDEDEEVGEADTTDGSAASHTIPDPNTFPQQEDIPQPPPQDQYWQNLLPPEIVPHYGQNAVQTLQQAVSDIEGFAAPSAMATMQNLHRATDRMREVIDLLVHDIVAHTHNAGEALRRGFHELAVAEQMIRQRDQEINRLRHPEVHGEQITPPMYSPEARDGEESVMRTPTRSRTRDSSTAAEREDSNQTLALSLRRPSNEVDNVNEQRAPTERLPRSAAPSYRNSPENRNEAESLGHNEHSESPLNSSSITESERDAQHAETYQSSDVTYPATPEARVEDDGSSSESRQSDSALLTRSPRFRRPSI